MAHLESKRIVHRDVAARNVLGMHYSVTVCGLLSCNLCINILLTKPMYA